MNLADLTPAPIDEFALLQKIALVIQPQLEEYKKFYQVIHLDSDKTTGATIKEVCRFDTHLEAHYYYFNNGNSTRAAILSKPQKGGVNIRLSGEKYYCEIVVYEDAIVTEFNEAPMLDSQRRMMLQFTEQEYCSAFHDIGKQLVSSLKKVS